MAQPSADALRSLSERGHAADAVALAEASLAGLAGAARAAMLHALAHAYSARGDLHVRAADLAVRYGGEEFLLALDDTNGAGAAAFALRLRQSVADHPWTGVAPALAVTTSIGVAAASEAQDINTLLALADQRLYAAKLAGRNRVVTQC